MGTRSVYMDNANEPHNVIILKHFTEKNRAVIVDIKTRKRKTGSVTFLFYQRIAEYFLTVSYGYPKPYQFQVRIFPILTVKDNMDCLVCCTVYVQIRADNQVLPEVT